MGDIKKQIYLLYRKAASLNLYAEISGQDIQTDKVKNDLIDIDRILKKNKNSIG